MSEIQNPTEEPAAQPVAAEPVAETTATAEAAPSAAPSAEEEQEATAEPAAEADCTEEEPQAEISTASPLFQSKAEVLARLKQIAETGEESSRQELDSLKSLFYRLHKQEIEEAYKSFIDGGGTPEEYQPAENNDEAEFKAQMAIIRENRAQIAQQQEAEREANYQKKLEIIEKIKAYIENPDEVNRVYNDFKQLQQDWNEIKNVPAEKATELWKTYQQVVEQYYDTLKLNNELRAYDFKKNLERKTALCEAAEKLTEEEDIIAAFRKLQQLHAEFREIGPVQNDLREEIWNRFKAASTIINKRHYEHFEARKQQEEENLQKKTEICETIESYDLDSLKTFAEWNQLSEKITELQAQWKTIGYAPQKMNVKIFERFRAACDRFFTRKAEYFQTVRSSLNENYEAKLALVEKAEELKDSTDWKATTDILIELQKKWKEIGTVPKKYSDQIWQRFNAACDAFFAAKKEAGADSRSEQQENLQKKQSIIERLAAIDPADMESELRDMLRKAQQEWNEIGHVPFKEKDKLYKLFREQMDRLYGAASANATRRRVNNFKNAIKEGGADRLRDRLLRQLDILRNEIKTYENNLGFLNPSSKSKQGNALVEELNRKVDKLRSDLEEVKAKLSSLDEKEKEGDEKTE
ncbi:MAG: DUF349 domain-containing protein [Bacteroidaceae bacterium]|nr:DUF349 domain-containing protein [Bacteroidaceae bacterium]